MKKGEQNRFRAYHKALLAMRGIIDAEYGEGGKLPSEVTMCERLNISRMTYRKVLDSLALENIIKRLPHRGHWVLKKSRRVQKVGIVINDGADSPFLPQEYLWLILRDLRESNYMPHLIQASCPENIYFTAITKAVNGLLWIYPSVNAVEQIRLINDEKDFPVLGLIHNVSANEKLFEKIPYVGFEFQNTLDKAARYFISQGHEHTVYVSTLDDTVNHSFSLPFQQANISFDPNQIICDSDNIEQDLKRIFKKKKISAIFTDGGSERIEQVLRFCMKLPKEKRPILVGPQSLKNWGIKEAFPGLAFTAYQKYHTDELAVQATRMIVDCLKNGTKIVSKRIQAYSIVPVR